MSDWLDVLQWNTDGLVPAIAQDAETGDVIVVTGMGSFQTRSMNDGPMVWDEREVAREIMEKYC